MIELLTPCYGDGVNPGTPNFPNHAAYEILDPTKEFTYTFMRDFFEEIVANVTMDEYVHLGMDEVRLYKKYRSYKKFDKNVYLASFFITCDNFRCIMLAGNHHQKSHNS